MNLTPKMKNLVTFHFTEPFFLQVFTLVRDNKDEVITSQLPELKNVRFIRVYPTEWYDAIAIRMEIYGCMKGGLFSVLSHKTSYQFTLVSGLLL